MWLPLQASEPGFTAILTLIMKFWAITRPSIQHLRADLDWPAVISDEPGRCSAYLLLNRCAISRSAHAPLSIFERSFVVEIGGSRENTDQLQREVGVLGRHHIISPSVTANEQKSLPVSPCQTFSMLNA